jgi:hypothetical protein
MFLGSSIEDRSVLHEAHTAVKCADVNLAKQKEN